MIVENNTQQNRVVHTIFTYMYKKFSIVISYFKNYRELSENFLTRFLNILIKLMIIDPSEKKILKLNLS